KMRDLILQLSKSSIYSTKSKGGYHRAFFLSMEITFINKQVYSFVAAALRDNAESNYFPGVFR
ncbi:hypothetical protein ACOTX7_14630, partial [Enterobacter cloacae complex sp. IR5418]